MSAQYVMDPAIQKNSKLIQKNCEVRETGLHYKVLKYDEKFTCDNDETLGVYRSVILSDPEEEVLCFSPPKSLTPDVFKERNPDIREIHMSEAVEGTMISLFWDPRASAWELATKGSVGGNYWFYRTKYLEEMKCPQKTFRQMFLEALRADDLNTSAFVQNLPKGDESTRFCYNFVLQHPDNHIVLHVPFATLFLVSVYGIESGGVCAVAPETYQAWRVFDEFSGLVQFPQVIEGDSYDDIVNTHCTVHAPFTLMGVMCLNTKTGERTCLENAAYAEVKELRGNHPNIQYQYLCLRRMDKVMDFLAVFPQYTKLFRRFQVQFDEFITHLHMAYFSVFVKKTGDIVSKKYHPFICRLHYNVYLPSLSTEKVVMTRREVKKQVLLFPPSDILFYLNYNVSQV
jgi:hypothetical protein